MNRRRAAPAIFGEKASDVRDTSLACAGRHRDHRRSARVHPARRRQGRARPGDRARGDRAPRKGPRRRAGDPRPQHLRAPLRHPRRPDGGGGTKGLSTRTRGHARSPQRAPAFAVVAVRGDRGSADDRDRGHAEAVRRVEEAPRAALPRQGREAAARRRASARRDEDGQGLGGGERKIQPGDKMAGRHGNKGVVSKIVPSRTCRSSRTEPRSTSC